MVMTDKVSTSYFQTQRKSSLKQAHWQDFLMEFDFVFVYKPMKVSSVVDTLSRKVELNTIKQP